MVEALVLRGSSVLPVGTAGRSAVSARPTGPGTSSVPAKRPLTLTRRGRLVLIGLPIVLGVSLLVVLGAFLTSAAQAGEEQAQTSQAVTVTVLAGETLWGIAQQHAPDRDTRDVVAEIVELNSLRTSAVQVGQSVLVPAQG